MRKLCAQFSENRILVIIKHLASYKIGDSFTFANFTIAHVPTGALYEAKKLQRGLKWAPCTDTDSSLRCVFFSKLRFSIFPLEQVEPSKLFNNMKLLILIFDWDEKTLLIIIQVQIMKIEWKLYLETKKKFSQVSHLQKRKLLKKSKEISLI